MVKVQKGYILDPCSFPCPGDYTHVIHAAATSSNPSSITYLGQFEEITLGTKNVLDWIKCNTSARILYISSGAVYGNTSDLIEQPSEVSSCLLNPRDISSAYRIGKLSAEHLCHLYTTEYGLTISIARLFAFAGPDLPLDKHFAIGNFVHDALYSKIIRIKGNGKSVRSYMDQRDLANWIVTILLRGQSSQVYNVGSDRPITILDLARSVKSTFNSSAEIRIENPNDSFSSYYVPDIGLASSTLNLSLEYSLTDSLNSMNPFLSPT